jgi:HEAT repeat protein
MGELGDPAAAGPLSRRAGDDDPSVRAAAVSALGRLKAGGCEAALLAGLRDPSSVVRANAADALGLIGDSRHAEALARSARDEDVQVRIHAVRALGAMGTTTVLPALVEVLRDRDIQVRLESVLAIGKTGLAGPETIDPLIDALTTDWFPVRDEASMILKKITGQDLGPAVGLWRAWRAKAGMNQRD